MCDNRFLFRLKKNFQVRYTVKIEFSRGFELIVTWRGILLHLAQDVFISFKVTLSLSKSRSKDIPTSAFKN